MRFGYWDNIECYGDRIALITGNESISYKSLSEISDNIADNMTERALLFLVCRNRVPSIAGFLGFLRKHIVPVLLNSTIDKELYENLMQIYRPQYVWCPDNFTNEPGEYGYDGYKIIKTGFESPEMNDDLALLVMTSGSTGSPKLVRLSYHNLQANTESIVQFLDVNPNDRAITTMPMNYVYGLSILQTHLMAGASIILTERLIFERNFWNCFSKNGATTFGAVPYFYRVLDKLSFLNLNLPSLRYITQAGGKLGKELHYKLGCGMLEKGKKFIVMYGSSEATARMSYVPSEMTVEKAGSIGIAIPGGRIELINSNGDVIKESEKIGELVYYGPNVMLGYATSREDLSKGDELLGRLETGDIAKRDDDGYYYIVGRKNRFIKIFGNRINLSEIEELLGKKGYETACVGEEDKLRIYTTSDAEKRITDYLCKKTGIDRTTITVIHIEKTPRNQSGKILYSELADF